MPALTDRALERRLKRYLRKEPQHFFAACAPGFEDVAAREVAALPEVTIQGRERGGVAFSGLLDTLYHANLHLRTAHRVLLRIDDFLAQSYPALFDRVSRIPWELYLGFSPNYSLRVSAKASRLRHHKNISLKADRRTGFERPSSPWASRLLCKMTRLWKFTCACYQDRCSLSLNTSGAAPAQARLPNLNQQSPPAGNARRRACCWQARWGVISPRRRPVLRLGNPAHRGCVDRQKRAARVAAQSLPSKHMPSFQPSKWERLKSEAVQHVQPTETLFIGSDLERTECRDSSRLTPPPPDWTMPSTFSAVTR